MTFGDVLLAEGLRRLAWACALFAGVWIAFARSLAGAADRVGRR